LAVKIKDIAQELGLSNATVSMVINNKPGISEETRKRVLQKLVESGYRNDMLRKLPIGAIHEIAFVVCKKHGKVVGDTQFFSSMIEEVEHACRDAGYILSLSYLNFLSGLPVEQQLLRVDRGAQGLLVLATELEAEDMGRFQALGLPVVAIDSALTGVEIDKVLINNFEGAYKATDYLVSMGHRRIGHLYSVDWIKNFDERRAGYLSALKHRGLEPDEAASIGLRANTEDAYRDMLAHLKDKPPLPTAFFVDNDVIALGAMRALKESGYSIPGDVSVIGFDDIPACTVIEPPLTTMRVECKCIGKMAVERLVHLIKSRDPFRVKQEIDTILIERGSVRRLNC
jgi:DNA-binding LacI/PurR family transcriptional regulator